jgi:demethylmenaquinone methyltransferase/2-methoxy-6-polyprenyl-1,4-benzoquinol methylase
MFDAISPTYDTLNHLLSLNLDRLWRRAAVRALQAKADGLYLDLCTGTGDVAFHLKKSSRARVAGVDFSSGMLRQARRKAARSGDKLLFVRGDAMAIPFKGGSLDGVVVAFGVRNFEDLDRGLSEMARVLKPGGHAVILEFGEPRKGPFGSAYLLYFRRVLPFLGRVVSRRPGAYSYLPATVASFPAPELMEQRMAEAGLRVVLRRPLTGGAIVLYAAERGGLQKSADPPEPKENG